MRQRRPGNVGVRLGVVYLHRQLQRYASSSSSGGLCGEALLQECRRAGQQGLRLLTGPSSLPHHHNVDKCNCMLRWLAQFAGGYDHTFKLWVY
jgi:hypothetical protein